MKNIFQYPEYRSYLKERLGGDQGRTGLKKKAADAIKAHTTLISQVLRGDCNLSLEQAEGMNQFLAHEEDEANYFLLLVMHEKAGSHLLRKRIEKQLAELKKKRLTLSERAPSKTRLSPEDAERFYSNSVYTAIHVLVSLQQFGTIEKLSEALGRSHAEIRQAVEFLKRTSLVSENQGRLSPGSRHLHLPGTSPHIFRHHLNWRLKTIDRLQTRPQEDLHYSGVVSLSQEAVDQIKESLLENFKSNTQIISESDPETAYVYCFDFYKLANSGA